MPYQKTLDPGVQNPAFALTLPVSGPVRTHEAELVGAQCSSAVDALQRLGQACEGLGLRVVGRKGRRCWKLVLPPRLEAFRTPQLGKGR